MKARGFTLVELVLVIALLGVLGGILGPVLGSAVQGYDLIGMRRQIVAQARAGMERMVREIRLIPGVAQVVSVGTTHFQFQYPIGTNITYSLNGTDLLRNADLLIANVNALSFTYYDETGSATAIAANVRSVGIQFTVDPPGTIPHYTLRTRTFLRNTGNQYGGYVSQ